jgi:hypothetical protein
MATTLTAVRLSLKEHVVEIEVVAYLDLSSTVERFTGVKKAH